MSSSYDPSRMDAMHLRSSIREFKSDLAALRELLNTAQPQAIADLKQAQATQAQAEKAALAEVMQELDSMREELKTMTAAFQALAESKQ